MAPGRRLVAAIGVLACSTAACSDDGGGDLDAFCDRVDQVEPVDFQLDVLEPTVAVARLEEALEVYEPLQDVAPPGAREHVDVLVEFVRDWREALGEVDPADRTAGFEATSELEDRFGEVTEATRALTAFEERQCPATTEGDP